ncbi:MAG TPA: phosphoribosylglycinamide formyltransferase [Candidatus Thermoplasmatota archaeon]|nr:phosphoribosylglycinamide formyltransferase [Candidatus Thermoplasmatota archaeon]
MTTAPSATKGPLRVAVLASGNGSNLQALLDRIATGHVEASVVLVVSDKPDAPAIARARRGNVPAVVALPKEPGEKASAYDERLLALLQAEKPGLVVLAGYMRIVGPAIVRAFAGRLINIHPALLPAFKGLQAVRQAHAAGVPEAGCSTHLVTDDLDGGPPLLQAGLKVRPGETLESLQRRILALEHLVLPRTVQLFAEGRIAAGGRIAASPATTWKTRQDLDLVSGAWYSEGF